MFQQTINWLPGGAQGNRPEIECSDAFLVAVRVRNSHDHTKEWWEFSVIVATETGFDVEDVSWGWSWDEVEWYVPVSSLASLPVPDL